MPSMLDRLAGLASRPLNPSPSATPAADAQPRGGSLRDAVNAVTATTSARGEGRGQPATKQPPPSRRHVRPAVVELTPSSTEAARTAVARYQYLLQTAPPGQLERVHTDAFNRLTPVDRTHVPRHPAPACSPESWPRVLTVVSPPRHEPQSPVPARIDTDRSRARTMHPIRGGVGDEKK